MSYDNEQFRAVLCGGEIEVQQVVQESGEGAKVAQELAAVLQQSLNLSQSEVFVLKGESPPVLVRISLLPLWAGYFFSWSLLVRGGFNSSLCGVGFDLFKKMGVTCIHLQCLEKKGRRLLIYLSCVCRRCLPGLKPG